MNKKFLLALFLGSVANACALIVSVLLLQEVEQQEELKNSVISMQGVVQRMESQMLEGSSVIKLESDINKLFATVQGVEEKNGTFEEKINNLDEDVRDLYGETNQLRKDQNDTINFLKDRLEGSTSTPAPTPTPNPEPEPEPEPTTGVKKGRVYGVHDFLNVRSNPGLNTSVVQTLKSQEHFEVLSGEQSKDNLVWIKIKTSAGNVGWVAKKWTKELN